MILAVDPELFMFLSIFTGFQLTTVSYVLVIVLDIHVAGVCHRHKTKLWPSTISESHQRGVARDGHIKELAGEAASRQVVGCANDQAGGKFSASCVRREGGLQIIGSDGRSTAYDLHQGAGAAD